MESIEQIAEETAAENQEQAQQQEKQAQQPKKDNQREVQKPPVNQARPVVEDSRILKRANAAMFNKSQPVGRAPNPIRVQICKDMIMVFDKECRRTAEDRTARISATNGLVNAIRSLDTLNREDTHEVLRYMTDVIRNSKTGAFERTIVFSNLAHLRESEREVMSRMLHLVTVFAETTRPQAIRKRVDPSYCVQLYKSEETRLNIDSFFPELG